MVRKNKSGKGEYEVLGTRVRVMEILDRVVRRDLAETMTFK